MITLRRADNDISEDDDDSYKPGPYWSLMLEISEGPLKEISNSTLVEQVRKRFFSNFIGASKIELAQSSVRFPDDRRLYIAPCGIQTT